jgi:hypothetical protein
MPKRKRTNSRITVLGKKKEKTTNNEEEAP